MSNSVRALVVQSSHHAIQRILYHSDMNDMRSEKHNITARLSNIIPYMVDMRTTG
jgi:hypothetical protein